MKNKLTIEESSVIVDKKLIAFEVSEELRQKIRKEAFDLGLSVSAMIRLILSNHYNSAKLNDSDVYEGR